MTEHDKEDQEALEIDEAIKNLKAAIFKALTDNKFFKWMLKFLGTKSQRVESNKEFIDRVNEEVDSVFTDEF